MQTTEPRTRTPLWLHGGAVDLLVGCGAWSAPLLLITYFVSTRGLLNIGAVFYVLMLFCNNPHYMATIDRAYGTRLDFRKYRLFTVYTTAVLVIAGVFVHCMPGGLPWIVTLYLAWSPWHYTGQNFGLAMLWARRNGTQPTRLERNGLYVAFLASYLMWVLWMQSIDSTDPNVLSVGLPANVTTPLRVALLAVFVVGGSWSIGQLVRRSSLRVMSGGLLLLSSQLLWFVVPTMLDLYWHQPLPPAYYTGGVLAFMHCAQYLWVTTYYAQRETALGERGAVTRWNEQRYYTRLVLGGILLFIPGPWLISTLFEHDLTDSLLIFAALVNLHHFILDGAVWKLRDGRVARLLLGSHVAPDAQPATTTALDRAWEWVSAVPRSRGLRLAAMAAIVAVAVVDQLQYYLTVEGTTAGRLALAAELNRHDTRVLVRHAALLADGGSTEDAIAELERAVVLNPRHASALRMLGSVLVRTAHYREAAEHYERTAQVVRPDLTTLINTAVLSAQAGNAQQAEVRLHEALRLEPDHPEAQLDLAEVYFTGGRFADAVPHYRRYLDLTASTAIAPQLRAAVAYKLAQAYRSLGQADAARAVSAEARALEQQETVLTPPDRQAAPLHAADAPERR